MLIFLQFRKTRNFYYPKNVLTLISENRKLPPAMEPASSIIRKLGGEAVVSDITGTAYTAPYRWQHEREKGGTGGLIPQRYHRTLLDYAHKKRITLKSDEFLPLPVKSRERAGAA